jgi:carboxyl-terminal processing protease
VNNAQKEAALMQSILSELKQYHYQPLELDDRLSEKIHGLFLDRMDGARRWMTQSEVQQLDIWKNKLDDEANSGSFAFLDQAILFQEKGIEKTRAWYREILAQPFDFTSDEVYEADGKKKPFAKDDAELKEYWRKSMKWETMTRLAEKAKRNLKKNPSRR